MANGKDRSTNPGKLSAELRTRLARLESAQTVRVILLLGPERTGEGSGRRQSFSERREAIDERRRAAQLALKDVDKILAEHGGQRLTRAPNALGAIAVETTAAGIESLEKSPHVRAVLEDQAITGLPGGEN